jgi:hypothetical protein
MRLALSTVRRTVADAFGLDGRDLECPQLTTAMTRALRVPGATPERLAEIMTSRTARGPREIVSARDPMAVMVWAAGDLAVRTFQKAANERAAGDGEPATAAASRRRLALLDVAIARQREARLALMEVENPAHIVVLVGVRPDHPAACVPWRRAAAAITDYRDAAGIFDRQRAEPDPLVQALGPRREGPALAAMHDEARTVVAEARADILLAEIARHVPTLGPRPGVDVEALAQRSLRDLHGELARLRELEAERDVLGEQFRPKATARYAAPDPESARMRATSQAINVRSRRQRVAVVTEPPEWVRRDVASRAAAQVPTPEFGRHLAVAYGSVALHADRSGQRIDVDRLEDLLGSRPVEPELLPSWEAAQEALAMIARPERAITVDLDLGS